MQPRQPGNRQMADTGNPGRSPEACRFTREHLFEYVDGELNGADFAAVRAHIRSCADCANEEAATRKSEAALSSALRFVPPPGDLRSGFYARLAQSDRRASKAWAWRAAVPVLAAAALIGLYFRSGQPPTAVRASASVSPPAKRYVENIPPEEHGGPPQERQIPRKTLPDIRKPEKEKQYVAARPSDRGIKVAAVPRRRKRAEPIVLASAANTEKGFTGPTATRIKSLWKNLDSRTSPNDWSAISPAASPLSVRVAALGMESSTTLAAAKVETSSTVASVEIVDEERGFKSKTRVASINEDRDGDQVITIRADSAGQIETSRSQ